MAYIPDRDYGEVVFKILSENKPDEGDWLSLNAHLIAVGLTDIVKIKSALHHLQDIHGWATFDPQPGEIRTVVEVTRERGSMTRITLPPMTVEGTSIKGRITFAGWEIVQAREQARHETELARKQNISFDEVMTLAQKGAKAAEDSAAAAKDAVGQSGKANRRQFYSNLIAFFAMLAAMWAAFWPMYSDTKKDRLIVLPLLYTQPDRHSDPSLSTHPDPADSLLNAKTDSLTGDSAKRAAK